MQNQIYGIIISSLYTNETTKALYKYRIDTSIKHVQIQLKV